MVARQRNLLKNELRIAKEQTKTNIRKLKNSNAPQETIEKFKGDLNVIINQLRNI